MINLKLLETLKIKVGRLPSKVIFALVAAFVITAVITVVILPQILGGPIEIAVFSGDGNFVADNLITELMLKADKGIKPDNRTKIESFSEKSKLYQKGKGYFIKTKKDEIKLNSDYPIFLNNGAYLYLYHNNFLMIDSKFEQKNSKTNTYISNGAVFNKDQKREGNEEIILIKLANKLYINAEEIRIEMQNKTEVIKANSVIRLKQTGFWYYNLEDKKPEMKQIPVENGLTMLSYNKKTITYQNFYSKLNTSENAAAQSENEVEEYRVSDDIYQYFLGNRYEYKGDKVFYREKDGYLLEANGERFLLYSIPFYFEKERKILLPSDYVLVEPKEFSMKKQPAMSLITSDDKAVYARIGDKISTYTDMFLFDGADSYIFLSDTEISIGDQKIPITPFSNVNVGKDGTVEIYKYDTDEYSSYPALGSMQVNAKMKDGIKLNLSDDILYQPGGKEQILFSQPSLLEAEK